MSTTVGQDPVRIYRDRRVSAEEATRHVRSGSRVFVGSGCAEPQTLVRALCAHAPRLRDIEIVHLLTLGIADYVDTDFMDHFRHNAFFIGSNVRQAVQEGRADYTPIFLSEIPELITSGQRPVDVSLVQLSPPDRHGYCSMGIHVDIMGAAIKTSKLVIAEVNPRMPRTLGDTQVHVSDIDYVVEVDEPLLEIPVPGELDDVTMQIGFNVARLIENGSCLQLGIGNIPNAVLRCLTEKRDLGLHTEMFSDGTLPLFEAGVITNSRKAIHPGKSVTSFVMGTRRLYDFVDDNPSVEFYGSGYVNDPRIICQNDRMVAVNSALQVDLTGQVSADSIGYRFFSGIGGQVDFIRGAAMSKGGKPIIALPSTAKGGTISRIVARLDEGAGVVTSRGDVHYVVTEYGRAYLHGKTIRERALALVNVAHPDYRKELLDFVRGKHYVTIDEEAWEHVVGRYPADWEHEHEFGGDTLLVRPVKPTDERMLQEFFYSHDPETVYSRYFHRKMALGRQEATTLVCVGYHHRMAFGVFDRVEHAENKFVAVGRYDVNPRTNLAEMAVVVHEDYRKRGIGVYLFQQLMAYARTQGIAGITTEMLPENRGMIGIHKRLGHPIRFDRHAGVYKVKLLFEELDAAEER